MSKLKITSNSFVEIEISQNEVDTVNTIDIFKVINGQYRTNVLVTTLDIKDAFQSTEIDLFCALNNCYYDDSKEDDVLYCNRTNAPIYWVR